MTVIVWLECRVILTKLLEIPVAVKNRFQRRRGEDS